VKRSYSGIKLKNDVKYCLNLLEEKNEAQAIQPKNQHTP
jgi:hypothetical protein